MFTALILFPLSAMGQKDEAMRAIDAYIAEHDYNAALLLLNIYIEQNPKNFDAAHRRISKVIRARDYFAKSANTLIDVMLDEPENHEKKLRLIAALESMEKNPSASSANFLAETKRLSQFTYYRAQFADLMQRGTLAVRGGNYNDAMRDFLGGLDLYQVDFFQSGYPQSVTGPVRQSIDALASAPRDAQFVMTRLEQAVLAFNAAVATRNRANITAAYNQALAAFRSYADTRNEIQQHGIVFRNNYSQISQPQSELSEASFLAFAYRFVLGQNQNPYSGMLGALDVYFERAVNSMKNAVVDEEQKIGQEIFAYASRDGAFNAAPNRTNLARDTENALWLTDVALNVNGLYTLLDADEFSHEGLYPAFIRSIAELKTHNERLMLIASNAQPARASSLVVRSISEPRSRVSAFRENSEFAATLVRETGNSREISQRVGDVLGEYALGTQGERTEGYGREAVEALFIDEDVHLGWDGFVSAGQSAAQGIKTESDSTVSSGWAMLASFYSQSADEIAGDYEARFARAQTLYEGDDAELSYPREALNEARSLLGSIQGDKTLMQNAHTQLEPNTDVDEQVPYSLQAIARDIERLDALELNALQLSARSEEKAALAQRALNEAELRYAQAVQATDTQDFESARDNLQRARTRFNESLELQESVALRRDSDARISALDERITSEENEFIVREVRDLKTRARAAYYDGDFDTAENLLTRAQSRWRVTNVEDDIEIRNLLALVGTAISMKMGRVIPITAPLYPEMSQILNISHHYYNQGASLLTQGRRAEAEDILNLAKQKLKELQLVYHFNQEANLLLLRIDRLIDPRAFETQFTNRVVAARSEYRILETQQQAYTDLLDLYEINPAYPGLRNLIVQVEIDIGLRPRPIDQAALNRSRLLTSQALSLLDRNGQNEVALRQAIALVDEAIALNPNNSDAIILKDRTLSRLGGQTVTVLSGADENEYQRAVQELQRGNVIEAKAIVEALLQKDTNRRSFKVLELQRKVDSLL